MSSSICRDDRSFILLTLDSIKYTFLFIGIVFHSNTTELSIDYRLHSNFQMINQSVTSIYLSIEDKDSVEIDYENDHTDVIVEFDNGDTYVAAFLTFGNIESLRKLYQSSGEFLEGQYFWAMDMLLTENCSREKVEEVIEDLMIEGNFFNVFRKL